MPLYKAYATMHTDLVYTFEAANDEEARQIAEDSDGSEYQDVGGDWDQGSLFRVSEKNNHLEEIQK